jgi:glycosyl transferase family 25
VDRRNFMASQFKGYDIPFEFITGIDGSKLTKNELDACYDGKKAGRYENELNVGEIGCSLSHRLAYQIIISKQIDRSIILEDDAILTDEFFVLIECFDSLPLNGYIVKLERFNGAQKNIDNKKSGHFTPWHRIELNGDYFIGQPLHNPHLTWGYYIDLKAAHIMFSLMPKIFLAADGWWYFRKYIKLRMISKAIITNDDDIFPSIIGEREYISEPSDEDHCSFIEIFLHKIKKGINLFINVFY